MFVEEHFFPLKVAGKQKTPQVLVSANICAIELTLRKTADFFLA